MEQSGMERLPPDPDRDDSSAATDADLPPAPDASALDTATRLILKVSARSRPSAVAGAIAGVVRAAKRAEVHAIGAGATNQAVKALAIARVYLADDGIDMVCMPEFIDVIVDQEERTAMRFIVEPR